MTQIINRPWGYFEDIIRERTYVMKRIVVRPGQRLSLQKHEHRSEFWVIMEGTGTIELGTVETPIKAGSTVNIQKKEIHRVSNTGTGHMTIYETQYGICDEEDIVRISDDYGR